MQKLIKLSEDHYVVIDRSVAVKDVGTYVFDDDYEPPVIYKTCEKFFDIGKTAYKITHSFGKELEGVENRLLSEAQEIEYGYNVEDVALNLLNDSSLKSTDGTYKSFHEQAEAFMEGVRRAHKELTKDKSFVVEDLRRAIVKARVRVNKISPKYSIDEIIQSLLPPIEWQIEFINDKIVKF